MCALVVVDGFLRVSLMTWSWARRNSAISFAIFQTRLHFPLACKATNTLGVFIPSLILLVSPNEKFAAQKVNWFLPLSQRRSMGLKLF